MGQVQFCKLQVHKRNDPGLFNVIGEDGGWFIKMKCKDGKVKYHLVDQGRKTEVSVDSEMVDETMHNGEPTKPFYLVCSVPLPMVVSALSVSPEMDEITTRALAQARVDTLETEHSNCLKKLENAQETVKSSEEHAKQLEQRMDEFAKISSMHKPCFLYAYGKHSAEGNEFAWRIPYHLYDLVHEGSTVIVETKYGLSSAVVTRIEKSAYLLEHKAIVSMA